MIKSLHLPLRHSSLTVQTPRSFVGGVSAVVCSESLLLIVPFSVHYTHGECDKVPLSQLLVKG